MIMSLFILCTSLPSLPLKVEITNIVSFHLWSSHLPWGSITFQHLEKLLPSRCLSELGAAAAIDANRQALYCASVCTAPTTILSASQEPRFAELREMRKEISTSLTAFIKSWEEASKLRPRITTLTKRCSRKWRMSTANG